jgi:hypothetical protein
MFRCRNGPDRRHGWGRGSRDRSSWGQEREYLCHNWRIIPAYLSIYRPLFSKGLRLTRRVIPGRSNRSIAPRGGAPGVDSRRTETKLGSARRLILASVDLDGAMVREIAWLCGQCHFPAFGMSKNISTRFAINRLRHSF